MRYCRRCYVAIEDADTACPFDGSTPAEGPNPDKLIGAEVSGRRVVRRLGADTSAVIYLANHVANNTPSAVRVMRAEWLNYARLTERFLAEARSLAALDHPNIATVLEVGTLSNVGFPNDPRPYVQMELLAGPSLADRLKERTRVPMVDAIRWAKQICSALSAAHSRGIVHRDLRPSNIYFTRDDGGERVKLVGFTSLEAPNDSDATIIDVRKGAADYMSPEQILGGAAAAGPESDLYSLGAILFELAVGRRPKAGDERDENPRRLLADLPDLDTYVSPAHEAVILQALEKNPSARVRSADAFRAGLEAALAAPAGSSARPRRRSVVIAGAIGVLAVAGAIALAFPSSAPAPAAQPAFAQPLIAMPVAPDTPHPHLHVRATLPLKKQVVPARAQPAAASHAECDAAEQADGRTDANCDEKRAHWTACLEAIEKTGNDVSPAVRSWYSKREASLTIICEARRLPSQAGCADKAAGLLKRAQEKGLSDAEAAVRDIQKECP